MVGYARARDREAERGDLPALREIAGRVAPVSLAGDQVMPVPAEVAGLLPRGGLRRGSVVCVGGGPGATSLLFRLLAGVSAEGSWVALVGMPDAGMVAAGEHGLDLGRVALVPDPGASWPTVVGALVDALDVVVVRPPGRVRAPDARRLASRARERGAVLVVAGGWPEAPDVRLDVERCRWDGLGDGHGVLRARVLTVVAGGRGAAARERRREVHLS